jgi:hypothetical protein
MSVGDWLILKPLNNNFQHQIDQLNNRVSTFEGKVNFLIDTIYCQWGRFQSVYNIPVNTPASMHLRARSPRLQARSVQLPQLPSNHRCIAPTAPQEARLCLCSSSWTKGPCVERKKPESPMSLSLPVQLVYSSLLALNNLLS